MRTPEPPPLPDDLEALLRRLRLPHIRRAAPEVLATARAQRWEPAEVLRSLLGEELAGRERSALQTRRKAASFPSGKTFEAWEPKASSIPATDPGRPAHPGMGAPAGEPGGVRPIGHGQDIFPRSAWPGRRRGRHKGGLVRP